MRYRGPIERAAKAAGVDPDRLEALVFLESAGRPDALAPGGIEGAAGLTQILAETATSLLGMQVDVERSGSYTRRLDRALREGNLAAGGGAEPRAAARRRPLRPRQGAGRDGALPEAGARALRARGPRVRLLPHGDREPGGRASSASAAGNRSYAELYFDSTPLRHPKAYARLASFGDDSSNYYWKLGAAIEIMRLARSDPSRLGRLAALQTADDSARRVLLDGAPQGDLRDAAVQPG